MENSDDPESLTQRFDSLCVSFGEDIALIRGEQEISYVELQEISKILACQIHYRYRPDFVLLDCFGHAVAEAAILAACMRLSIPFVPISTEQQAISLDKVVQALRQSENVATLAICCVSDDQNLRLGAFYDAGIYSILMVDECGYIREQLAVPDKLPATIKHSDALYVLFTSGTSGGVPKGVIGSHQSTFRRLAWFREAFSPCQYIARRTPLTFVDGVTELLGALLEPASVLLVLSDPVELMEQGLDAFFHNRDLRPSQITLIPSQLEQLFISQSRWKEGLERIILSGEPCPERLYRKTRKELPKCQLLNLYGQTETTGDALCAVLSELEEERAVVNGFVTVGRPILPSIHATLCTLDEKDTAKIALSQGELVISGNMSVGYLSNFVLGEERWTEFPTGDIAFCDNGLWYIKGRKNELEKINGVWTSPSDVEIIFEKCYSTRIACSIVHGNLYALIPEESIAQQFSRERIQVETKLPLHMIPQQVYRHDIPLSSVGKIDRSRVKNIIEQFISKRPCESFINDVFDNLVSAVLDYSTLDPSRSFIDLGGTSSKAVKLLYEFRRSQLEIPDDLTAVDILTVDSLTELKAVVHGISSTKRRKILMNPSFPPFQPQPPSIVSPKHKSVRFRGCVDSCATVPDYDPSCFFIGCQGGVIQKVELKSGNTQAYHYFPGWMIQSEVVVFGECIIVCGYKRSGQGLITCFRQNLQSIVWQKELDEPVKHTPILDGEVIQVVCGRQLQTLFCASGKEVSSIKLSQTISSSGVMLPSGDSVYASSDYECSDLALISKSGLSLQSLSDCHLGPVYKDILRVTAEEVLIADSWGSLHLIALPSLISISLHVSTSPLSPPELLSDGSFVLGSYDGFVHCLRKRADENTAELVLEWSVNVGAAIYSKPVRLPGKNSCIVCTTAGHVVQIEKGHSKEVCRVAGEIWSNPRILLDDLAPIVVFGARDSRMHLVKLE
jgi:acyl-CoA synthetase (AMP-forming)/AMP-acid ligase II